MEKDKCAICGADLTLKEEAAHVILKESHDNGTHEWEICQDCADDAFWEFMNRKEPITKNNLGVDCVSRQAVLELIADYDFSMGQVVRGIHALPPVTPQEPRKGRWIFDGDCLICNKCNKAYSFTGSNFCPNCGADMREVEDGRYSKVN